MEDSISTPVMTGAMTRDWWYLRGEEFAEYLTAYFNFGSRFSSFS